MQHYRWNVLRVESISFRLWIHSYSPNCVSNVPSCSQRILRVNRGPSSWFGDGQKRGQSKVVSCFEVCVNPSAPGSVMEKARGK